MTFQGDWRGAFPGVNAASHFRMRADEYIEQLRGDPEAVAADIDDRGWVPDSFEGVPQPALDEVESLFDRAREAVAEGDLGAARGHLEDVIAYCTPPESP